MTSRPPRSRENYKNGKIREGKRHGQNHTHRLRLAARRCAASAQAETYPDRPIRLIVSIAAGSVTDVIMRTAAVELTPLLGGQPLVIENRGGASGIVAAQACAQAAPDGYTLCVIYHSTMSYNPLLFDHLPYDPDRDLVPVARLFFLNEGLFVSTELGVNSVAELKAMAQTKSDKLNYATLGEGSFPDLFLRWLNNQWGTKIVGVPYKGGGPAAQALAGNQVQLTRFGIGNFLGLVKAGKVKALAVSADKRSALLAGCADAGRGRARRLSRARLVGAGDAEGHAAGDWSTRSTPPSSRCSASRNSPPSWTSRRWCRRRPRRPASPRS